ncbi:hypothetical protein J7E70_23615 [Variovorax paradoxus]|nr:hypothetical protein [Variovorax paradoxus]MBT2303442.1 hypothetical protein [Variovorax paradoxus]
MEEKDLREWLGNSEFTPYPALARAIFRLLSRPLRKAVFIDVIAFNYEETPGVKSSRRVEDVDQSLLMRSVLEGDNIRHGERLATFAEVLA